MPDSDGRRNNVERPGCLRSFAWAVLAVSAATGDARAGAESLGKGIWVVQGPEACEAARIASGAKSRGFSNEKLVVSRTNAPYRTLIRFDLAGVPKGRPVKDAALLLYCCKQYHVKSSWDDFDGIPDFTMVYESRDAPPDVPRTPSEPLIPSRRWQVWRAGVQDYHLLQQAAGTSPQARDRIDDIVDRVLAAPADPAIYREARQMLLALLTSGPD